ncbi:MAG: hypothetical protein KGL12_03630 [Rhodospirillales bacterium]|nr:hypothetical protein [Rhodospirillales bacterium]
MDDALRLSEFLAARLCHDLSGLAATLGGACAEAADGNAASRAEALALARQAAEELAGRLRLLRAAWGPPGEAMNAATLAGLAASMPAARRVAIDLSAIDPAWHLPAPLARLVLNLLLLAGEALGGGGGVAISGAPGGAMLVSLAGPRAAWPAAWRDCLASADASWAALTSARGMQAPLTALIAHAMGARLTLLLPSGTATGPAPLLIQPQ